MILVDTSVWIDHFRNGNDHLAFLLNEGNVFCHPFIIGELACGNLKKRTQILSLLHDLPQSSTITHDEVLLFIEKNGLMGKDLGHIDVCILASAIMADLHLWTYDNKLNHIASSLGSCYIPDETA